LLDELPAGTTTDDAIVATLVFELVKVTVTSLEDSLCNVTVNLPELFAGIRRSSGVTELTGVNGKVTWIGLGVVNGTTPVLPVIVVCPSAIPVTVSFALVSPARTSTEDGTLRIFDLKSLKVTVVSECGGLLSVTSRSTVSPTFRDVTERFETGTGLTWTLMSGARLLLPFGTEAWIFAVPALMPVTVTGTLFKPTVTGTEDGTDTFPSGFAKLTVTPLAVLPLRVTVNVPSKPSSIGEAGGENELMTAGDIVSLVVSN
jgi:hypothetical protein